MQKPQVSVIVPLYNKAKFVERCLDSIAKQRCSDFEAIVVNDGSTDGGEAIAMRYTADPRFRVLHQANAGPGAARNRGIENARGDVVAFLDADDLWLPESLEVNLGILARHQSIASVSGGWIEYPEGVSCADKWRGRGIREGICRLSPDTPVRLLSAIVPFMWPCATVVRTEVLRHLGGFEGAGCHYAEDGMLWLKLLLKHPVYLHLRPVAEFHREASALSGNFIGPRPVEPFLANPGALREICPAEFLPLLDRFFAQRACKTACMLGYWGQWRAAAALVRHFVSVRDWRAPGFALALLASTPLSPVAGSACRVFGVRPRQVIAPARGTEGTSTQSAKVGG